MAEKKQEEVIIKLKQGITGMVVRIFISFLGIGSVLFGIIMIGGCLLRYIKYGEETYSLWDIGFVMVFGFLFFIFGVVFLMGFPYSIEVRKENLLLKYPFFRITIPNEIIKKVVVYESFIDRWNEIFLPNIFFGIDINVVLSKRKFFLKTIYLRYEWIVDRGEVYLLDELVMFYERLNQEKNSGD